ncbi:hypothetical protein HDV57DRAFT_401298 [Trichoderma longibrachiatum]
MRFAHAKAGCMAKVHHRRQRHCRCEHLDQLSSRSVSCIMSRTSMYRHGCSMSPRPERRTYWTGSLECCASALPAMRSAARGHSCVCRPDEEPAGVCMCMYHNSCESDESSPWRGLTMDARIRARAASAPPGHAHAHAMPCHAM